MSMSMPRGRPPKTPETDGLMSWEDVAERVGLSVKETRRIGERALLKLKYLLVLEGVDHEYTRRYRKMKEEEEKQA